MTRRPRILVTGATLGAGGLTLDAARSHYVLRVLRLRPDDGLSIFDGRGTEWAGRLIDAARDGARVLLEEAVTPIPESPLEITLHQCVARGERMDLALQKATELGVYRICPVLAERTEVKLSGTRLTRRLAHWRGVVGAACEQCGRATVPEVTSPRAVTELTSATDVSDRRLLLSTAAAPPIGGEPATRRLHLLVGPEGGLSEREERLLRAAGWRPVSLGPRILRTETAGPAALASLNALWGDAAGSA